MNLINAIQTIGRFTNTAVISPETTFFSDNTYTVFGVITVDGDVSETFGLYDNIASLQRILSLFEDPKISIVDSKLEISDEDSNSTAYFLTSDTSLINRKDFDFKTQLERTLEAPQAISIDFTDDLTSKIRLAAGTIDLSRIVLTSKDNKVTITVKDTDMLSSDSNSFNIDITSKSNDIEKEFAIVMDPTIFSKMPKGDFTLDLFFSSRTGTYRAVFKAGELIVVTPTNNYEGE